MVNDTLGERPVAGVLYTHSHADHFGGARGVISEAEMAARNVPVIAPAGFSEAAVSENLLAGNLMSRRSVLMFGNILPRTETGHVGSGLGPGLPQGTIGLVLPSEEIPHTGGTRIIDGVTFEFIDAAGTEAPAEFMFYLPEKRALCTAEVATKNFHNVLTPRGAKVRDALYWSQRIDKVLADYGDRTDVVFASHHWPTWGAEASRDYLARQRDIYRYVHDQTLRLANAGRHRLKPPKRLPSRPSRAKPLMCVDITVRSITTRRLSTNIIMAGGTAFRPSIMPCLRLRRPRAMSQLWAGRTQH